jgi:ATP-binding cassette subfamily B protein
VLFSVGTAVAFIAGARLYQTGDLTLGAVYLIVHYTGMLSQPMQRILQEMEKLQQAGAGVLRIQELLAEQSKIKQMPLAQMSDRSQALPSGPLSCALNHVTFSYAKSEDEGSTADDGAADSPSAAVADQPPHVLHNVSFRLAPGRILGLLGRTGSGKTTVARLLARLYDPDGGCVTIGGLDLRTLPLVELRQRIGVVTQNVQLFHATVRDNLTFFDEGLPDSIILDLLDELGLSRWYAALPQGLDTLLAADGGGLSAGEAQLLAFARLFLKDPGLVILDEASSRLDPATEQLIERAVDRLLHNRTAMIIAHRLATIQRADEILILEQGRILEHGPRTALAADPQSRFFQLLQTGLEEVLA